MHMRFVHAGIHRSQKMISGPLVQELQAVVSSPLWVYQVLWKSSDCYTEPALQSWKQTFFFSFKSIEGIDGFADTMNAHCCTVHIPTEIFKCLAGINNIQWAFWSSPCYHINYFFPAKHTYCVWPYSPLYTTKGMLIFPIWFYNYGWCCLLEYCVADYNLSNVCLCFLL